MKNTKWLTFFAVSLVAIMINMDATIVNLALASIAKELHASLSQIQWVINLYMLTNIVFIVLVGRISDIIGKRAIYLLGIAVFTVASIFAGMSHSLWTLLFARGLQGVGLAATLVLGIVIVANAFPKERQGIALGAYMTVAGIAQSVGPFLGGTIIQYFGWRWIFLINIPIGFLAVIFVLMFCQKDKPALSEEKINWYGIGFLCLGLSLVLLALNELGNWGFFSVLFWSALLLGLFFVVILYLQDRRVKDALINYSLFKNRSYRLFITIRALYMYGWLSMLFILPLYLQNIIGYSPFASGAILLCMTLVFGALSPIAGLWIDRIGYIRPTIIAAALSVLSFIFFAQLGPQISLFYLVLGLVLFGLSAPIMGSASAVGSISNLPSEHAGLGMGIFYMLAFFGASVGVALSGSFLSLFSMIHFTRLVTQHGLIFNDMQLLQLHSMVNGSHAISAIKSGFSITQVKILTPLIKMSFTYGLSIVMYLNVGLSFIAFLLSFGLKKPY